MAFRALPVGYPVQNRIEFFPVNEDLAALRAVRVLIPAALQVVYVYVIQAFHLGNAFGRKQGLPGCYRHIRKPVCGKESQKMQGGTAAQVRYDPL